MFILPLLPFEKFCYVDLERDNGDSVRVVAHLLPEVRDWLNEHTVGSVQLEFDMTRLAAHAMLIFENDNDRLLFKMRWL